MMSPIIFYIIIKQYSITVGNLVFRLEDRTQKLNFVLFSWERALNLLCTWEWPWVSDLPVLTSPCLVYIMQGLNPVPPVGKYSTRRATPRPTTVHFSAYSPKVPLIVLYFQSVTTSKKFGICQLLSLHCKAEKMRQRRGAACWVVLVWGIRRRRAQVYRFKPLRILGTVLCPEDSVV